jgi:hypothetical protein
VTFQQITYPEFESHQRRHQATEVPVVDIAAYKLGGSWRRSGPQVQQRYVSFTSRKHLVDDRQISDQKCQKGKPGACLGNGQNARSAVVWHHISEAQSEECGTAEIQRKTEVPVLN